MRLPRRSLLSTLGGALALPGVAKATAKYPGFDLQAAIDKAAAGDGILRLAAGQFALNGSRIDKPVRIEGVPGLTRLVSAGRGGTLLIDGAAHVSLAGLTFVGDPQAVADDAGAAMVRAERCEALAIDGCAFESSGLTALALQGCSGRIERNRFAKIGEVGIAANDSRGLTIADNQLDNMGNAGIQVFASASGEDGTIVSRNRIAGVKATRGGSGQWGNGINVFRAGNVIVADNRVSDCAFSAIRNNNGANSQIVNNSISRCGEVALYCEFDVEGAVVSGNLIEQAGFGISIANFDHGTRMVVVSGNVIRDIRRDPSDESATAAGIGVEADTVVTGNIVDNAAGGGISLGWGPYCRNLTASNNLVRNCGRGIMFSTVADAGPVMITGNRISGAKQEAIVGMNYRTPATGDLGKPGAAPAAGAMIANNLTD